MVKLNFMSGIVIGILILPVLFAIFILYLYLKDKVEDFLYRKKYNKKEPLPENTKKTETNTGMPASDKSTNSKGMNTEHTSDNPAEEEIHQQKEHGHHDEQEHHHEHKQQQETL